MAAVAVLAGCRGGYTVLSPQQLDELIAASTDPTVVVLWADWSRPSVELLPSVGELAAEYEGRGVAIVTVSMGQVPKEGSRNILQGFSDNVRRVTLEEEPTFALARFGVSDLPAVLVYAPGGGLLFMLDSTEASPLTPAELSDVMDAALAGP